MLAGIAWLLVATGVLGELGNLGAVLHNLRRGGHRSLVLIVPWIAYAGALGLWRAAGVTGPWRLVALLAALHLVWWLAMAVAVALLRRARSPQNRSEERP